MIADQERELISIKTKTVLQAARACGVQFGKPENLSPFGRLKGSAAMKQAAVNTYPTK